MLAFWMDRDCAEVNDLVEFGKVAKKRMLCLRFRQAHHHRAASIAFCHDRYRPAREIHEVATRAVLGQNPGQTAKSVAAHISARTVGVDDRHVGRTLRLPTVKHNAIRPFARAPVTDSANLLDFKVFSGERLRLGVDEEKVVPGCFPFLKSERLNQRAADLPGLSLKATFKKVLEKNVGRDSSPGALAPGT